MSTNNTQKVPINPPTLNTPFEQFVYSSLLEITADISEIKTKLNTDYKTLHGNGKLGLVDEVNNLKTEVNSIKLEQKISNSFTKKITLFIGWLVTTLIAIIALFKHTN